MDARESDLIPRLPGATVARLRDAVPEIAEAMISAVMSSVPEYGSLAPDQRGAIRGTAQTALFTFLARTDAAGGPGVTDSLPAGERAWRPGSGAFRSGRSLEALQAAFRVAARAGWSRIAQIALEAGTDAVAISQLAGALFLAVERIAGQAAEAYADAQASAAGERELDRIRLAELLTAPTPPALEDLRSAAARAGWRASPTVAVIALGEESETRAVAAGLGTRSLPCDLRRCVIVPDPAERWPVLRQACVGLTAAIGPEVPLALAGRSLRWAQETLALVAAGRLPGTPAPVAGEHLLALALARGGEIIDELARRHHLPEALAAHPRLDLALTLGTWLRVDRSATATAALLHLHPQTVRYRVARAREILGDALDDPAARFELQVALHTVRA